MKTGLSAALFFVIFSLNASAKVVGYIDGVSKDRSRILVNISQGATLQINQTVQIQDSCDLRVLKIKASKAILSTASCSDLNILKKGVAIESAEANAAVAPGAAAPPISHSHPSNLYAENPGHFLMGLVLNDISAKVSNDFITASSTNDSQGIGLNLMYTYLPVNSVGFVGGVPFITKLSGSDWESYSYIRPNINVAFTPTEAVSIFGGINMSKYFSPSAFSDASTSVGYQVGGLFKVSEEFEISAQYFSQKLEESGTKIDINGFEFGFNYLF